MTQTTARYHVGQLIHHRLFDYRGVIADVDPIFQGPEDWYEQVAQSRPPKDRPWYHVLVDGKGHETYVAERNLEVDAFEEAVAHPLLDRFFSGFEQGRYINRNKAN